MCKQVFNGFFVLSEKNNRFYLKQNLYLMVNVRRRKMYSEDMFTCEKSFKEKLKNLTAQKDQFAKDSDFIFNLKKIVDVNIYENGFVVEYMVEHTEILNIVILSEWVSNIEVLDNNEALRFCLKIIIKIGMRQF